MVQGLRTLAAAAVAGVLLAVAAPTADAAAVPKWKPSKTYAKGDLVRYEGITWRSTGRKSCRGVAPATNWRCWKVKRSPNPTVVVEESGTAVVPAGVAQGFTARCPSNRYVQSESFSVQGAVLLRTFRIDNGVGLLVSSGGEPRDVEARWSIRLVCHEKYW